MLKLSLGRIFSSSTHTQARNIQMGPGWVRRLWGWSSVDIISWLQVGFQNPCPGQSVTISIQRQELYLLTACGEGATHQLD